MPSINSIFGLLEKLESQDITVHQTRCAVVRNRNARCMKCAEVCTSGCISYEDNELIISPEKCIGCGTCATVCPTCALEAHSPNDAELQVRCLAAAKANDGVLVIACQEICDAADGLYDAEKVVPVTCLGRVEETLITAMAVAGAQKVVLVKGKCAECPHVSGMHMAELVADTANTLLSTWNNDCETVLAEKFPKSVRQEGKAAYDHNRREFFTGMKGEAKTAAATTADYAVKETLGIEEKPESRYLKVMDDGTLPHFIPDRRERLLNNLATLGEPQDIMIETRLWGHVIIDPELCSSCQMCATFCPTGAISKFEEEDGTFGVEHFPGDCVKCRCCTDICPENALSLSDEVFAVDLLSGAVERYEMKPMKHKPGNPHQILDKMKDLIGIEQIYER